MSFDYGFTASNRQYPERVYYKRREVLELTKADSEIKMSVIALTKEEAEAILFYGNKGYQPDEYPATIKFPKNGKRAIKFKGHIIPLTKIEMMGEAQYTSKYEKFMRQRTMQGTRYYMNYGSGHFNYYGAGLVEAQAAWKTICQLCSITECFMIWSHA